MVYLIKPPYDPRRFRPGESLGLATLAGQLARHEIPVKLLDPTLQRISGSRLLAALRRDAPELVGLTLTCSAFVPAAMDLSRSIKQVLPDTHLVWGGPYPTFAHERLLREIPEIDSIIRFEGERALLSLVDHCSRPDTRDRVPNLAFRDGNTVLTTAVLDPEPDLDRICWPARSEMSFGPGIRDVAMLSSRGCPWDCSFCIQSRFYRKRDWRGRTAEDVCREMEYLRDRYRAGAFLFNDDNFIGSTTAGRNRAGELADILKARKFTPPWAISCLPVDVDGDLFRDLAESGLSQVFLGIESGVQEVLDRWNKKVTVATGRAAVETLRFLNLGVEIGFILFDPDTTLDEIRENISFLQATQAANTAPFLNRLEVHPGMAITERLQHEARLQETDFTLHYRFEDARVETLYRLYHSILPAFSEAENLYLQLRFEQQTGSGHRKISRKKLQAMETRLSDEVCRHALRLHRFVTTEVGRSPEKLAAESTRFRNEIAAFTRSYRERAGRIA